MTALQNQCYNKDYFANKKSDFIIAKIIEPPDIREKNVKLSLEIVEDIDSVSTNLASGKIVAYFSRDSNSCELQYGDIVVCKNKTKFVEPYFIGDFDYQKYLNKQGVYYSLFANGKDWRLIERNKGNILKHYALVVREKLLQILKDSGLSGREYAISAAILFGYGKEIDDELMASYQSAGTLHILCVSGMHLGLFSVILSRLLFFLKRKKLLILLRAVILLLAIWSYSLITGFAPSILRAAVMFSFTTIGTCLERNADIINSLAISAFILLICKPVMLFNIGFQLSYLAVVGIVLLQKPIDKLFKPKFKAVKYIWELTTVSIAAQLATGALCIYYFGIFPNYFLLANYVACPISTLFIPVGIATIIIAYCLPQISFIAVFLLKYTAKSLNVSMEIIGNLPFSVTKGLEMSIMEVILFYCGLAFAFYSFKNANRKTLFLSLLSFIIMLIINILHKLWK